MKVNVKQEVFGPEGEPFMKSAKEAWTLGGVFITALGNAPVAKKTLAANFERFDLAVKIRHKTEVEFTIDEAKTIQDCLIGQFTPFMVAAAARLLEASCGPDEEEVITRKPPKKKPK